MASGADSAHRRRLLAALRYGQEAIPAKVAEEDVDAQEQQGDEIDEDMRPAFGRRNLRSDTLGSLAQEGLEAANFVLTGGDLVGAVQDVEFALRDEALADEVQAQDDDDDDDEDLPPMRPAFGRHTRRSDTLDSLAAERPEDEDIALRDSPWSGGDGEDDEPQHPHAADEQNMAVPVAGLGLWAARSLHRARAAAAAAAREEEPSRDFPEA